MILERTESKEFLRTTKENKTNKQMKTKNTLRIDEAMSKGNRSHLKERLNAKAETI